MCGVCVVHHTNQSINQSMKVYSLPFSYNQAINSRRSRSFFLSHFFVCISCYVFFLMISVFDRSSGSEDEDDGDLPALGLDGSIGLKKRRKLEQKAEKRAQRQVRKKYRKTVAHMNDLWLSLWMCSLGGARGTGRKEGTRGTTGRGAETEGRRWEADGRSAGQSTAVFLPIRKIACILCFIPYCYSHSQLEEERIEREERERKEEEEYQKMKASFQVEAEGEEPTESEGENRLQQFVDFIKTSKIVLLEELAAHFHLRTQVWPFFDGNCPYWSIDWLIDWLNDRLIDWLIRCLSV